MYVYRYIFQMMRLYNEITFSTYGKLLLHSRLASNLCTSMLRVTMQAYACSSRQTYRLGER